VLLVAVLHLASASEVHFVGQHLEPLHGHIRAIFRAAEARWQEIPEHIRGILKLDKRTHANVMWQFLVHEAKTIFTGTNVTAKPGTNTIRFSCGNHLLMRFKKISEKGISSNYPTQTALEFNMQMILPHMPEAMRVDLGWVADSATLAFTELRVVERRGGAVAWMYSIPDADEATGGQTVTPLLPLPVDGGSRVRVVVPQVGKAADAAGA
jgi:hypothetical protein